MRKIYVLLLLQVAACVYARNFRLGRSKGGNLGEPVAHDVETPPARWFKQKLNHFSPTENRLWKQKYFINDTFYDPKYPGPVFLMIGGEGPASAKWMVHGAWIEYAKQFKALCIQVEHRFYGESRPTKDLSTKNLVLLSSQQALADLAYFIKAIKDEYVMDENVRWVVFGGSYPGSLATWLRMKYPHLVYAAVSSSGPLLAKVNFKEYFEVVVNALREKTGEEACVETVKAAHTEVAKLVESEPKVIEEEFKVCKPFSGASEKDKSNFYSILADNFADLVQYNEDNRIGADEKYRNVTINTVCDMLTEDGEAPPYKRLAAFNSIMLAKNNQTCLDYSYEAQIEQLRNVTWNSAEGGRQWMYQTCTEFGFYQTSSGEADVFGNAFPVDFFTQQCADVFGSKFDAKMIAESVAWTNDQYGGFAAAAGRVVHVHGTIDPWHALGVTSTERNDAPAVFIEGTAHCADMYPSTRGDLEELKRARIDIQQYLGAWLGLP